MTLHCSPFLRLCNSPIGTNGFSLVFLANFSLNVSSLVLGKGLKPSMFGAWDISNGTVPGGAAPGVCSATPGVAAAAMLTLAMTTRKSQELHFRLNVSTASQ